MSQYTAEVQWERRGARFDDNRYSRAHTWRFDGGAEIAASSSPAVVPLPMSDPAAVDPEEAFLAAISSCHMLWFLALAAKEGLVIDGYHDHAEAIMERDERGRVAMTRVTLRPSVQYSGLTPDATAEDLLHRAAHESCFIANSVRSAVLIEPRRHHPEPIR